MAISVLGAVRCVARNQIRGIGPYRLTEDECWCGSAMVLDAEDQPVCLELPFHDPGEGPVSR